MRSERDKQLTSIGMMHPQCLWSIGLVLFLLTLFPLSSLAAPPIVTIIDDDTRNEQAIEAVKIIADRCKIKVTFAAIASNLEHNPKVADLLRSYEAEGHELASHSLTHRPDIWKAGTATDFNAIEREVYEAENVFKHLELHPKSFVYPYGKFPSEVRQGIFEIVGKHYQVAFNARGDINLPGKTYPLYVSRHPLRKHNSMFMTKRLIDEALAAGNSWVVILTHSGNADFSSEMLETIIRYAQKSGMVFLPASAAWQQIKAWPMMSEDHIPDYTRFDDYANAVYFHLPLVLVTGFAIIVFCSCIIYVLARRRRTKLKAKEKALSSC